MPEREIPYTPAEAENPEKSEHLISVEDALLESAKEVAPNV